MFKSKYSTVLTVFLIILIIAIITIVTVIAINIYKNYKEEKERAKAIAEFQDLNTNVISDEDNSSNENLLIQAVEGDDTEGTTSLQKTKFYKDYPMIGYITIDKIDIEYPILLDVSPAALDVSVGVMYPTNPNLNEPGNTVIIGHNYRNGKFFSNNKNLVIGDEIKITDLTGRTLTYTIYEISTLSDTDTEYITRERGDNIEISLSTCTDDGEDRLVILARVE